MPQTQKRKLGILLSTPPEHQNLRTAVGLANEALLQKMDTYLYLIDDGVKNLELPEIASLSKKGVKLYICAYGAQQHGIPVSNKAIFCGLVALSNLVKGCDRFVSFS